MAAFLWGFPPENAVYLSLVQGIHDPEALRNNELVRRPLDQIRADRRWALEVIADWAQSRRDLVPLRLSDVGDRSPGRGYELGVIASVRYTGGAVPDDSHLLADALSFARALGDIYRAGPPPSPQTFRPRVNGSVTGRSAQLPDPTGIQVGTTVEARDLDSDQLRTWTIVAKGEANSASGKLSVESPIGQAMLGHEVGDTVSVVVPRGTRRYLIERRSP